MVQLWPSELFKKEYIQRYHLAYWVCQQTGYFSGKWFQFLTNFDPSLLLWLGNHGGLPLEFSFASGTIWQFQVMTDCYFQYYTKGKVTVFYSEKIIVIIPCSNMHVSNNYINTRHIHWFMIIPNNHSTPLVFLFSYHNHNNIVVNVIVIIIIVKYDGYSFDDGNKKW